MTRPQSFQGLPIRRAPATLAIALALALITGLPGRPGAHNPGIHHSVSGNLVDVQVRVDDRPSPLFQAPGRQDRHYFEAFRGRNYTLCFRNLTPGRIGVLITVDGLNVVNGELSKLDRHEAMYVLDAGEFAEIRGWRTSLEEVRRFVFVDEERSYAERSGKANRDMGWIRVHAFRDADEKVLSYREVYPDRSSRAKERDEEASGSGAPAAEAPGAAGDARSDDTRDNGIAEKQSEGRAESLPNPGTGWGERRRDVVNYTWFNPDPTPSDRITLRYEYASGLHALGIDTHPHHYRLREREEGVFGFAQPPKW